jgi:hypothetical protein
MSEETHQHQEARRAGLDALSPLRQPVFPDEPVPNHHSIGAERGKGGVARGRSEAGGVDVP